MQSITIGYILSLKGLTLSGSDPANGKWIFHEVQCFLKKKVLATISVLLDMLKRLEGCESATDKREMLIRLMNEN